MLWFVSCLVDIVFGADLSLLFLGEKYDLIQHVFIGIPLGIGISTLVFYYTSLLLGFNTFHLIIQEIVLGFISYSFLIHRFVKKKVRISKMTLETTFFIVVSIFISAYMSKIAYYPKEKYIQISFKGDFHEELSLMNSFFCGVNSGMTNLFKIRHPYCYKCISRTRWLTAAYSAMMRCGFANINLSICFPSFLYLLSFCFCFQKLASQVLKNFVLSSLTLVLALFCGGYGFYYWTQATTRHNMDLDFVFNFGSKQTEWSHPIFHYLFAFRPSQMSLSIVTIIMLLLFNNTNRFIDKSDLIMIGAFLGLLPPLQHQVFFGAVIFVLTNLLLHFPFTKRSEWKDTFKSISLFLISFVIVGGIPLILYIPRPTNDFLIEKELFYQNKKNSAYVFPMISTWTDALGLSFLVYAFCGWFISDSCFMKLYIASIVVFIFGNHYCFTHYNRHNIILFYPFCIILYAIILMKLLQNLSNMCSNEEIQGVLIGLGMIVFIISTGSAVLGFVRLKNQTIQVWDEEMLKAATWISQNTPKKALFAAAPNDYNIVSTFAGRVLYVHSPRLIWFHGFKESNSRKEYTSFLKDFSDDSLAPKIEYILNYGEPGLSFWVPEGTGKWTTVYSEGNVTIFKRNLNHPKKK